MAEQVDASGQLLTDANRRDARGNARFLHTVTPVLRGVVRAKGAGLGRAGCEDVLLEVHLKRNTWQPAAPVCPWLYAINRYKAVDAFRTRGRKVDVPVKDFATFGRLTPALIRPGPPTWQS